MKYVLTAVLSVFLFSCGQKEHTHKAETKFDIEPVKSHILKMNESYSERFMSNDSAFYVERYCHDAEVYTPNMPSVKGREAISKFFYNDGNNKEATIELPPGNFYGGPDYVVEDGVYNFPDGKGGSADKGKFIALWKQEDGKWKLYREIWNTDNSLPPPTTDK
jgi:ketosteroid isomerase-like protein